MRKFRLFTLVMCIVAITLLGVGVTAAQSPTQITFWHGMTGTNGQVVTKLVSDFNASHPDVQVTEQNKGSSYNDVLNNTISAMGQGQGPNIVQIFDLGTPIAIDSGFFTPVQNVLPADQFAQLKSDIMPPLISYFTVNDTLWSLPWNNSTPLFYYNKDMFKAAGLDPDKPPATWQELEDDCAKIQAANAAPYCITAEVYGWFFEQWMALQGQELANNGNGRSGRATETNFTSDASKAIFNFWKDLNDKGYYTYTGKLEDGNGSGQIFTSQQAAMILDSTGSLTKYANAAQQGGFTLGTGFFPTNGDVERQGVIIGGASLWVSAANTDAQNKAAVEFLTWLEAPEQMAEWHKGTGYMPITKGSQDLLASQGYFDQNPNAKTAVDQLADAKQSPATAGAVMGPFPQIRTLVDQAIQNVLNGADVDSTLSDLKTQADAALADYNSRLSATPEATAAS
ncbi:MAG TPA: ABC transporter substrate-binding protein [Phototrophicaceae bacterium]|nr:ABC transporter substrate-binding protein [Phototrophicaceae bacterium]